MMELRHTFSASYGEFNNRNSIETYYMAVYMEFQRTVNLYLTQLCLKFPQTSSVADLTREHPDTKTICGVSSGKTQLPPIYLP